MTIIWPLSAAMEPSGHQQRDYWRVALQLVMRARWIGMLVLMNVLVPLDIRVKDWLLGKQWRY